MKIIFFFVFAIAKECKKYMCADSSVQLDPNVCKKQIGQSVYLAECGESELCDTHTGMCAKNQADIEYEKLPGESCRVDSDCISKNCEHGKCLGQAWMESCELHSDCHVGLFCHNSLCWVQKDELAGCVSDFECQNWLGCYRWDMDRSGICLQYHSLGAKEIVMECKDYFSKFCSEGSCVNPGGRGICIQGIKPVYLSDKCEKDSDCVGESLNIHFYSECQCGLNNKGQKYCKPFLGDYLGKVYMQRLKAWYASTEIAACHTLTRNDKSCMSTWSGYGEYLKAYYEFFNYSRLQDNDKCVKSAYGKV